MVSRIMTSHPNGHFAANLPILNGKNYDNWCKQMPFILCYQHVLDLVKNGVTQISEDAMNKQKVVHKDLKNKYYKVLFIINQCVNPDNF